METMERLQIETLLHRLGVTENYTGHAYLLYGVWLCDQRRERLALVTKWVYPQVAKQFGTNWKAAEPRAPGQPGPAASGPQAQFRPAAGDPVLGSARRPVKAGGRAAGCLCGSRRSLAAPHRNVPFGKDTSGTKTRRSSWIGAFLFPERDRGGPEGLTNGAGSDNMEHTMTGRQLPLDPIRRAP